MSLPQGFNLKRTPRNLILNLGELISNDWDLTLCGRGGENLKTGSFQWHLANHHEDNCLLHGELVWLDAISEKCHFETYIHHWLPGSSPVDPGNSKRGRSLEKDYLIRNIKRLGKNSVVGKLVEKRG